MKVGFATADWAVRSIDPITDRPTYGGAGWARVGLPAKFLREVEGLDVVEGTLVFNRKAGVFGVREWPRSSEPEEAAVLHSDIDLIVLQRWMFASVAVESVTARRNGQVVVNDLDDHFWAIDPKNQAAKASDPLLHSIENRDHYLHALRASTALTVSTPYLVDVARRLGVKVPIHVLENHVDLDAFQAVREARQTAERDPRPVYGWVGATPWRSGDLETLRGVLAPFLERHGLYAFHGGHKDGAATFADLVGLDFQRTLVGTAPMVPIREYSSLFGPLDVGLVPLRDVIFNRAKSWIKGLEYAAAGVPFIAQDLPEYRRLEARGIGRVASRPREWTRLMEVFRDPDVRAEETASNLAGAKALDIRQGIGQWRDLYLDLLANA